MGPAVLRHGPGRGLGGLFFRGIFPTLPAEAGDVV